MVVRQIVGWPNHSGWVPQAQDDSSSARSILWAVTLRMHADDGASCRFATQPFWLGHPAMGRIVSGLAVEFHSMACRKLSVSLGPPEFVAKSDVDPIFETTL